MACESPNTTIAFGEWESRSRQILLELSARFGLQYFEGKWYWSDSSLSAAGLYAFGSGAPRSAALTAATTAGSAFGTR